MKTFLLSLLSLLATGLPFLHADVRFRNGDVFDMRVSGPPEELTREFTLTLTVDEGAVTLPLIGRVAAVGMSSSQLASTIERRLKEAKIFSNPNVNITVGREGPLRTVIVGGAVRAPGRQTWAQDLTLTGAISAAGGASEFRKDGIRIVRNGKATMYSWKAIRKNPSLDPKVEPGDIVEQEGD